MTYYVYIIYSEMSDSYYIGQTIDINKRIQEHNSGFYSGCTTRKACDWQFFYSIECNSRRQALQVERHLKRMGKRKYYYDLKQYPEIAQALLIKYKE